MGFLRAISIVVVLLGVAFHSYLHTPPHAPLPQALTYGLLRLIPDDVPLDGFVAPGYEKVAELLKEQVHQGYTVGHQFDAYIGDKHVVSLAAGWIDQTYSAPYTRDTLQVVWSSGKAVMSIVFAHLVSKGYVKYDDLVSKHWPEYAQGGKEDVRIQDLLMHRGGVTYLDDDRVPTAEELASEDPKVLDALAAKLAGQPHTHPNDTQAYHAVTRGWFLNEIVRRVHPEHKTYRQVLLELVQSIDPKLEAYCGLPPNSPHLEARMSPLRGYPLAHTLVRALLPRLHPQGGFSAAFAAHGDPDSMISRAVQSRPKSDYPYNSFPEWNNDPKLHYASSPSITTITNAKALAVLAGIMANKGKWNGKEYIDSETFEQASAPVPPEVMDGTLNVPFTMARGGFAVLSGRKLPFMLLSEPAFEPHWLEPQWKSLETQGWGGAGGSTITWSSSHRLAFSYVMNSHSIQVLGGDCSIPLYEAVMDIAVKLGDLKP